MSIQSASFAVYKSKTKELLQVQGEWISENCASDDLFTVCRINFDGNPINYWVRFAEIYDKLEDEDWLVCTDTDGITYKVSGTDFYNTKDPLRFIKIKNPVINWTSPQPGGQAYVVKNTTTINGEEPVVHEGNWGYRENAGLGAMQQKVTLGSTASTVRGIAFEEGSGFGMASVQGHNVNGTVGYTINNGGSWIVYSDYSSAQQSNTYDHEVFWLKREQRFAILHQGRRDVGMALAKIRGHEDRPANRKILWKVSNKLTQNFPSCSYIDDDVFVSGYQTTTGKTGVTVVVKKDPNKTWAPESQADSDTYFEINRNDIYTYEKQKSMIGDLTNTAPFRICRYGDDIYFYLAPGVFKFSISKARTGVFEPEFVCFTAGGAPYVITPLPFLDQPSLLIAGGDGYGTLKEGTMQWLHLVGLSSNDKNYVKLVETPTEHIFTSRVRASTNMNNELEVVLSDYNGRIAATSDGIHYEYINHNIDPTRYEVRALSFAEASGSGSSSQQAGLFAGTTKGRIFGADAERNSGYSLIAGATDETLVITDQHLNKSLGWVEKTTEALGRTVEGASSPTTKINLYGVSSDIHEHPELLNVYPGIGNVGSLAHVYEYKTGRLTDENMALGQVINRARLTTFIPSSSPKNTTKGNTKAWYGSDFRYHNSRAWGLGDASYEWAIREENSGPYLNTDDRDWRSQSPFTPKPMSEDSCLLFLLKVYSAHRDNLILMKDKFGTVRHYAVDADCCIYAYSNPKPRSEYSVPLTQQWGTTLQPKEALNFPANSQSGKFLMNILDVPLNTTIVDDANKLPVSGEAGQIAFVTKITGDENVEPEIYEYNGGWAKLDSSTAKQWIIEHRIDLQDTIVDGLTPYGSYHNVIEHMPSSEGSGTWDSEDIITDNELRSQTRESHAYALVATFETAKNALLSTVWELNCSYEVRGKVYVATSERKSINDFLAKPPIEVWNIDQRSKALSYDGKDMIYSLAQGEILNGEWTDPLTIESWLNVYFKNPNAVIDVGNWSVLDSRIDGNLSSGLIKAEEGLDVITLTDNKYFNLSYGSSNGKLTTYESSGYKPTPENSARSYTEALAGRESLYLKSGKGDKEWFHFVTVHKRTSGDPYIDDGMASLYDLRCAYFNDGLQISDPANLQLSHDIDEWGMNDYITYNFPGNYYTLGQVNRASEAAVYSPISALTLEALAVTDKGEVSVNEEAFAQFWVEHYVKSGIFDYTHKLQFNVHEYFLGDTDTGQSFMESRKTLIDIPGYEIKTYDRDDDNIPIEMATVGLVFIGSERRMIGYAYNRARNLLHFEINIATSYTNFPQPSEDDSDSNCTIDGTQISSETNILQTRILSGQIVAVMEKDTDFDPTASIQTYQLEHSLTGTPAKEYDLLLVTADPTSPGEFTTVALPSGWTTFKTYSLVPDGRVFISNGSQVMSASSADWIWSAVDAELTAILEPGQQITGYVPDTDFTFGFAVLHGADGSKSYVSTVGKVVDGPLSSNNFYDTSTTVGEAWTKHIYNVDITSFFGVSTSASVAP